MATVRELIVSLGLDFDASGFAKAERAIAVLKTGFIGVGAVLTGVAAGLTGITVAVSKQADHLNDLAKTLGVSTDALQRLGYAAQLSGADAETMRSGLLFLARNANQAAEGSAEAAEHFAKFGVSLRDQNGQLKTADRLFLDVANGVSRIKSPTQQAALAAQLLGREAGPRLLETLKLGEAGVAQLGDELEALGGMMDGEFIEASAEFNDTLDRMQAIIKGVSITIAKAFLPFLHGAVKGLVEWYRANREVISSRVTFFVERMASAFNGLGNIIGIVTSAVGKVVGAMGEASPVFLTLLGITAALGLAFASPAFAIILLSALIGAIADDINVFVTGGQSVLGDFVTFMREWGQETGGIFGGLMETIFGFIEWFKGAGWDAVFEEMRVAFAKPINWIIEKFEYLASLFEKVRSHLSGEAAMITEGPEIHARNRGAPKKFAGTGNPVLAPMAGVGDDAAGVTLRDVVNVARIGRDGLPAVIGGGGASLPAAVGAGMSSTTTSTSSESTVVHAPINVTAAPGQSTEAIAEAVAGKVEERISRSHNAKLRHARARYAPAGAQ